MKNFIFIALLVFFSACSDNSEVENIEEPLLTFVPNQIQQASRSDEDLVLMLHSNFEFDYSLVVFDDNDQVIFRNEQAMTNVLEDGWRPDIDIMFGEYKYEIQYQDRGLKSLDGRVSYGITLGTFEDLKVYIPNAVVQSASHVENTVLLMYSRLDFIYDLYVSDRNGNVVFESTAAKANSLIDGWRPVNVPAGTYSYIVNFDFAGIEAVYTGDVTVFE